MKVDTSAEESQHVAHDPTLPPQGNDLLDRLEDIKDRLMSPEGGQLRRNIGTGLIVFSPFIARLFFGRRSRLVRSIAVAGGTIAIAKAGETLRSWEPTSHTRTNRPAGLSEVP